MDELRPMDSNITLQLLSKDTQRVMHFVEWYKDILQHDIAHLEAKIASEEKQDEVTFHKGEINALKRMINALDKDVVAYSLQHTEKFDDEPIEIPVYKCK